ncbi:MAG: hypothetical protein JXR34_10370, partial [Bacteroidales bacterium]|nr:hypothetical protein [Bacteroidales bacterium]
NVELFLNPCSCAKMLWFWKAKDSNFLKCKEKNEKLSRFTIPYGEATLPPFTAQPLYKPLHEALH